MTPRTDLKKHTKSLSLRHKNFKKLVHLIGPLDFYLPVRKQIDDAILYSIIGQMLSSKASSSITANLKEKVGDPQKIFLWAKSNHRKSGPVLGVSQRKRKALAHWLDYSTLNKTKIRDWKTLSLEALRNEISSIWGLGRWSSDMIAIFHFGRLNVWPETDGGISRACNIVFGSRNPQKLKALVNGTETIAALYLWELLNKGLEKEFK